MHLIHNIFSKLRYWQEINREGSINFVAELEHIINFSA